MPIFADLDPRQRFLGADFFQREGESKFLSIPDLGFFAGFLFRHFLLATVWWVLILCILVRGNSQGSGRYYASDWPVGHRANICLLRAFVETLSFFSFFRQRTVDVYYHNDVKR